MTDSSTSGFTDAELETMIQAAHREYAAARPRSRAAHERARKVLAGGNTRSVLHFDPFPFRVANGEGIVLEDIDGHRYVDFCGNYSAALLGHRPDSIRKAIDQALDRGWALGAVQEPEIELGELFCARFASVERVRFANSGTEANLMAVGTALHHTGRSGVGVFDHGYHGGVMAFGDLAGPHHPLNVPHRFHVSPFDDIAALDALFALPDLGCVLVEPVQGSGGCRPASNEFLSELRRRCDDTGVVLIFDEVMTSRLAPGGAQERYGVTPDLTTFGKYLAGGLSFGAFGGRADIMDAFDPAVGGRLSQAGTFNNNALSLAASVAVMRHELDDERIVAVNASGDRLREQLSQAFERSGAPLWVTGMGSMLCVHADDPRLVELFFHAMLARGHYVARRGYMALSMLITSEHIAELVDDASAWASGLVGR
ncbi:MAG: aminotransferase class III-fold pyridoxal phosphate-dependent enzyme [Acidimicrobiales bacterium]